MLRSDGTDYPNRRWLTRENAADAKPARNGQIGPDPVSWPLPFLSDVFMSGSAGHSSFSLCVCPSARSVGSEPRDVRNPPSSATSRRENCAASPTEMTREKKGHRESPRADDDAGTGNLAGTRGGIEWKWSGGDDARCRDVERYNNRNRLRFHYFGVQIEAWAEYGANYISHIMFVRSEKWSLNDISRKAFAFLACVITDRDFVCTDRIHLIHDWLLFYFAQSNRI